MKSKIIEDGKRRELLFRQSLPQSETALVSHPLGDSVAPSEPGSQNGPRASAAEPFQRAQLLSKQETDHLDEELDLLLNLDAPVGTQTRPVSRALSYNRSTEKDLKMDCKEKGEISLLPGMPLFNFHCSVLVMFWLISWLASQQRHCRHLCHSAFHLCGAMFWPICSFSILTPHWSKVSQLSVRFKH